MRGAVGLTWRIRAFFIGAVLGLVGIYLNSSWLLSASLIALSGGVAVRFWPVGNPNSEGEEELDSPPE